MGAGQQIDHYIQDGAELYFVAKLQEALRDLGVHITDNVDEKGEDFMKHLVDHKVSQDRFDRSQYKSNIDKHIHNIANDLIKKYDRKMDCVSVEVEYRNKGMKGDFILEFEDKTIVSYSLKNYKKSFRTIQVCSGTWPSFCSRFLLTDNQGLGHVGPGMYLDENGKKYSSTRAPAKREKFIRSKYEPDVADKIIDILKCLSDHNSNIKAKYVNSPDTNKWSLETSNMWKGDCNLLGCSAANIVCDLLKLVDPSKVKTTILKMCGFDTDCEELLCLDNNKYLCSSTNEKWGDFITDINSNDTTCNIVSDGPKICISFIRNDIEILKVCVPFTLQKNGGWFLDEEYKETGYFHPKEKKFLNYGDRRPKKSREISTSINTFINLSSIGLY